MLIRKVFNIFKLYFVNCLIAPLFFAFGVILFVCLFFWHQIFLFGGAFSLLTGYEPKTDEAIYKQAMTAIAENAAPETEIKYLPYGSKYAELTIERIGILNRAVFNCDDYSVLKYGWGQSGSSRYPGEGGRIILAGHKEKNTALFKIAAGDEIVLKTIYGTFRYAVSSTAIVKETDSTVLKPDDTKERLVLYTCYPLYKLGHHTERFVITADLKTGPIVKNIPFKDNAEGGK